MNLKNIVITGALDDSLDYDAGWGGHLQYLVIRQSAMVGGPDRMVEASNLRMLSTGDTVFTNPTIANFTMVGLPVNSANSAIRGIEMNATGGTPGSSGRYLNGVVTGSTTCLHTDGVTPRSRRPSTRRCLIARARLALGASHINAGANNTTNVPSSLQGVLPGPNELAHTAVNPRL